MYKHASNWSWVKPSEQHAKRNKAPLPLGERGWGEGRSHLTRTNAQGEARVRGEPTNTTKAT